jgi:pyruvate, water dikinase
MDNILWFRDISNNDVDKVGGKGASLGEMYNAQIPIPPGFCVTAQAYDKFLDATGLKLEITKILQTIEIEKTEDLEKKAKDIQNLILNVTMPADIKRDIEESYENLNVDSNVVDKGGNALDYIKSGRDFPYVAVRSSATAEDLPEASFAGQQASYLNIKGAKAVVVHTQKCWASLFNARAIYYREKNKFDHMTVLISVVIQKMVNSTTSGIMFTINPSTNNENEIIIEAGWGLGEAIVSGSVNPDSYTVDKKSLELKEVTVKKQTWKFVRDDSFEKTVKRDIVEEEQEKQVLEESEVLGLAKLGMEIEEHYGKPMDMEFALEGSKIFIVQARPVTTLKKKEEGNGEGKEEKKLEGTVLVKGLNASPGVASGTVKIIHGVDELGKIKEGDILVTEMTNPDYVVAMEKASAIVTDAGGATAHAAIVSRELGIPAVVGTETATTTLTDGQVITVDGANGIVYDGKLDIKEEKEEETVQQVQYDTITNVKVICDLPSQAEKAAKPDSDGVGLVRLEFIIAENGVHPAHYIREGREEDYMNALYEGLKKIASNFEGKPVWVRTSDVRSDEYRNLEGGDQEPEELNPMLGWHGIRRGLDDEKILETEFRAVKKLHDEGYPNVGVMLPFVINLEEVKKAKEIARRVGLEPVKDIDFGIMVETPAAVWIIEDICKEGISFISFGTNDLTQTTLGVDRGNDKIQYLYTELHPSVLKEIEHVIKVCRKYKVQTSICGQAGSNPEMVKYLVKYGIDSISANVDAVGTVRKVVSQEERRLMLEAARKDLDD